MNTASVDEKESAARVDAATHLFFDTLSTYRGVVTARMLELIPASGRYVTSLYGPMLDYPLREGKGFRPALCLATCQACGGRLEHALDTAVALEMFHNAFLIHDDIEDGSETRRGLPTLHMQEGLANATNVGDALNMLALSTLLGNTALLGLERSLMVIEDAARMARETTEGQALELSWIFGKLPRALGLRDYLLMTWKKTAWYTCISPMRLGAIIADAPDAVLHSFVPLGLRIGTAFQIQDDVLNLASEERLYGKELNGDIAEGKRTLMLIHAMKMSPAPVTALLEEIYAKPRLEKTDSDIHAVLAAMHAAGSIDFARGVARRLSHSAERSFGRHFGWIAPGPHRAFIEGMISYMVARAF
jgi:geranylgeranyl diphosphate synthase, type II